MVGWSCAGLSMKLAVGVVLVVVFGCAEWYVWVRAVPHIGPRDRVRGALVVAPLLAVGYGLLCPGVCWLVAYLLYRAAYV